MKKNGLKRRKQIWKRILPGLLLVFLACLFEPSGVVYADVLIEQDDDFWESHYRDEECSNFYREYTANDPAGYVILWESPVSSRQMEVVPNGTILSGNWHYTDEQGEVWCMVPGEYNKNGKISSRGWFKISECLVIPDHISFQEAYGQEFVEYDASYDHAFDDVKTVTLWKYPGSGIVVVENESAEWLRESPFFNYCWKDADGRMWGFIGYYYGIRNAWVCLDDPTGENLERKTQQDPDRPEESVDPVTYEDQVDPLDQDVIIYPPAQDLPMVKNGVTGPVVAGVAGVVAVTVLLLWFFFIRKKKK